jgi:hypothetical protein
MCTIRGDRQAQEFLKRKDIPLIVFFRGILLSECIISTIFGERGIRTQKKWRAREEAGQSISPYPL